MHPFSRSTAVDLIEIHGSDRDRSTWLGTVTSGTSMAQRLFEFLPSTTVDHLSTSAHWVGVRCRRSNPLLLRQSSTDGRRLPFHSKPCFNLSSSVFDQRTEHDGASTLLSVVFFARRYLLESDPCREVSHIHRRTIDSSPFIHANESWVFNSEIVVF